MTTLVFYGMRGIIPKLAAERLPAMNGQAASNIKTASGEIRPYRTAAVRHTPNKPMPPISMYRAIHGLSTTWLSWPFDVDVVRFPLSIENGPRIGWSGDGEPRWGTYSMLSLSGANDYPSNCFALGIPNPLTAPSVSASGGSGDDINRFYCCTFFSQHGEESGPSPISAIAAGKANGTWALTGLPAFPENSGSGTASYSSGVTTFTNTATAPTWLRVGDEILIGSDKLTVLSCPAAHQFTVAGDYSAATSWSRVAPWNTAGMKRRLYRTAGTAAGFQLVHDDVGTTYNDTLLDNQILGDELISEGWQPPPPGLKGVLVTPFGALLGFSGNKLSMSEPYQPHAFKDLYSWTTDYEIVAIALSGSDIVIGTTANLYIGVGSDPSAFGISKKDAPYPCLSKRSMASDGNTAFYATTHGLLAVAGGSAKIFTDDFYTVDEWRLLNPRTMFARLAFGRIFIGYQVADQTRTLILDMSSGDLFELDVDAASFYTDETTGTLYAGTALGIAEIDPVGGAPMALEWWSKREILPRPVSFGAAKIDFALAIAPDVREAILAEREAMKAANEVIFAAGDIGGGFGDDGFGDIEYGGDALLAVPDVPPTNAVTFSLYDGDELRFSKTVQSSEPFRLPGGYKTDDVSIKVNSQCSIKRVLVSETMSGLKQA